VTILKAIFLSAATLILPLLSEENALLPEAEEWPQFLEFEWGMTQSEFNQACRKKDLVVFSRSKVLWITEVKGKLLGHEAVMRPNLGSVEGEYLNQGDLELKDLAVTWELEKKDGEELFEKLGMSLRNKYGPPKVSGDGMQLSWGAPNIPHQECLRLEISHAKKTFINREKLTIKTRLTGGRVVELFYFSKSAVKRTENLLKKQESQKKDKEDEKDF
jgi:hypothetical protein